MLVSSCSKEPVFKVETRGLDLSTDGCYVDAITFDSMSFASGKKHWSVRGLIVSEGIEYPYSMMYSKNPFDSESIPVQISAPSCIDSDSTLRVKLTREKEIVMVSWKTDDQYLLVKTVLTSRR